MKYVRFYGSNGYAGCDYEDYDCFNDDVNEDLIIEIATERAYENAESYLYMIKDKENLTEEEEADYYAESLEYSGWEYITEEEYYENEGI